MKFLVKALIITLILFSLFGIFKTPISLALMNSENYINWMDSFNEAGEESSSSANYRLQDTLGEIGTGIISSANYMGKIGFRQTESDPKFTFSVSKNSIDFGMLTVGSVFSDSVVVTTTTNAEDGYLTTIVEDGNFRTVFGSDIDDVTDGEVTANFEEYGIRTSGAQGQMNGSDTAITGTPQAVAEYNSWITASATTINFKVSISLTSAAGAYEHNVTLISTGRF